MSCRKCYCNLHYRYSYNWIDFSEYAHTDCSRLHSTAKLRQGSCPCFSIIVENMESIRPRPSAPGRGQVVPARLFCLCLLRPRLFSSSPAG